jgi:hypothetical protein
MRRGICGLLAFICLTGTTFGAGPQPGQPTPAPQAGKLDLSSLLGRQVQEKFVAIDREVARLREAGATAQADELAAQARPLHDRLDGKDFAAGNDGSAELHLVGVYQGSFPNGPRKYGRATVEVEVTDRPIVLALSAYDPVRWEVRLAPGVRVQKVILAGYGDQELTPALEGVPVETRTYKGGDPNYFHVHKAKSPEYARAGKLLRDWTSLEVSTFQGAYEFKGDPIVLGPRNSDWSLQRLLKELDPLYLESTAYQRARAREIVRPIRFQAIRWNLIQGARRPGELADFMATGPIDGTFRTLPAGVTRVAVDPRGPTYYGIAGQGLVLIDLKTNRTTKLEIQGDIPELSWPCGLAFDTKRNRLVLTSLAGVGYMYAFEPDKNAWSLLGDMGNLDLESFTYSVDEDCLYGLGNSFGGNRQLAIHQFDASGAAKRRIDVALGIPADPMMSHVAPSQLIAAGGHLIVLAPPPPGAPGQASDPMTAYSIDSKTGRVIHSGPARTGVEPRVVSPDELARLFDALRNADSAEAEKAVQDLAAAGDPAVALLRSKLPVISAPDPKRVSKLVALLDAEQLKDRDDASTELKRIGEMVEPQLKAALTDGLSVEAHNRLEAVLSHVHARLASPGEAADIDPSVQDPDLRLRLRAVRVLALVATPAAVDCLHILASGPRGALGVAQARSQLRKL